MDRLLRRSGIDVGYDTLRRFALAELGFGKAVRDLVIDGESYRARLKPGRKAGHS